MQLAPWHKRSGMDLISASNTSFLNSIQHSLAAFSNLKSEFWFFSISKSSGNLLQIVFLNSFQRFLMGLRLGEYKGQSITLTPFLYTQLVSHFYTKWVLCIGALSWIKNIPSSRIFGNAFYRVTSITLVITLFRSESRSPFIMYNWVQYTK